MARLPQPGGDNGNWGDILNEYLSVSHASDGSLKPGSVGAEEIEDSSIGRSELTAAVLSSLDSADSSLQNITDLITAGPNITLTGQGTNANPYEISATIQSGNVSGPSSSTLHTLARFSGTDGRSITDSGVYVDSSANLSTSGYMLAQGGIGESSSTVGVHIGRNLGSSRIMFSNGDPATNWQIDNQAGSFRWFTPGVVQMTLRQGGLLTLQPSSSQLGIGTTPTHSLTMAASGTGVALYNTSDQVTNYERGRLYWSANVLQLRTESGGSGTGRVLQIGTTYRTFYVSDTASSLGFYRFEGGASNPGTTTVGINGTVSHSSGSYTGLNIAPTINQSGTASYTALQVNSTETSVGSGSKLLADFQVGGASRFAINNLGETQIGGSGALILGSATQGFMHYNTADQTTNYERAHAYWSSNSYVIATEAGTGSVRNMHLSSGAVGSSGISYFSIGSSVGPTGNAGFSARRDATAIANLVQIHSAGLTGSSMQNALLINPVIAQSGAGGYTALRINPTESSTGSGLKLLADLQVGGVSKFTVSSTGQVTLASQKITGLANGTVATDAAAFGQIPVAGSGITNSGGTWSVSSGGATTVVTVSTSTYTFPQTNAVWKGTLQASCTFSLPAVSPGGSEQIISAIFIQDATGGRTVTLPTGGSTVSCLWASGIAPSIPTTANSIARVTFQNIDGQWYGAIIGTNYA